MTNREVVSAFLSSYQAHDSDGMHACLDPNVEFRDLAYKSISGPEVYAMWRWFCQKTRTRPKPIQVPGFEILRAEGDQVSAEYWVRYSPEPGKEVNYVIHSEFTLSHGAIVRQVDKPVISLPEFARMAGGVPACLLALTPVFRFAVRRKMHRKLHDFMDAKTEGTSGAGA